PKPGSGGKDPLYVDGQKVADGRIPKTPPFIFSGDEGADVGVDNETMVSNDYKSGENKFTGKIIKVTIDTQPSNLSAADKKAVEDAEEEAAIIEDRTCKTLVSASRRKLGSILLVMVPLRTVSIGLKSHCHR